MAGGRGGPHRGVRPDPAEPRIPLRGPGSGEHRRPPGRRGSPAPAELHPPRGVRVRGQHGPGHAGRPALRAQPAPDLAACGALRHRQCPRGTAAGAVGAFRAGRAVRDDRHAGPQARACLTGTGAARGRAAGHPGHRGAAAAEFRPPLGRLLHDRTADKIAAAVSRIPNAAATIIPFDVESRVRVLEERQATRAGKPTGPRTSTQRGNRRRAGRPAERGQHTRPALPGKHRPASGSGPAGTPRRCPRAASAPPEGQVAAATEVKPIGSLQEAGKATVKAA